MKRQDVRRFLYETYIIDVVPPVDFSTLYQKTDTRLPGNGKPYLYSRLGNITRTAAEQQLATIHGTEKALILNKIEAAYYSLSLILKPDYEVICLSQRS